MTSQPRGWPPHKWIGAALMGVGLLHVCLGIALLLHPHG
jgi:hypothetical protein